MSEEEAYIAVAPPLDLVDYEPEPTCHEEALENPFELKNCYVRLQRMPQIELMLSDRIIITKP